MKWPTERIPVMSRWPGWGRWRLVLLCVAVMLLSCMPVAAYAAGVAGIPRSHADSLAVRQVVYEGRVTTFSTVAREVMLKLYGSETYRGLSAEQAVASLILYPEEWKSLPLMKVKDSRLRQRLGIDGSYAAMTDLFDSTGTYRLDAMLDAGADPKEQRPLQELDEKAGLMLLLWSGALFEPYAPSHTGAGLHPLSEARVQGELLYNRIPAGKILFMLLFSAAIIGFVTLFISAGWLRGMALTLQWVALALAVWQYGMIWWLGGHVPLGSMQDTLLLMVIVMLLILAVLPVMYKVRRGNQQPELLQVCGWMGAGAFALVAWLNAANPAVTGLSPMLASPWLSIHVTLVMVSYALLAMSSIAALSALLAGRGAGVGAVAGYMSFPGVGNAGCRRSGIAVGVAYRLLLPGVVLLGLGIFTGSAWASTAWGRWWAWDPKETFALVSFIVYLLPLLPPLSRRMGWRGRSLWLSLAVLTLLMTYFGVNYLPSIHAYTR